MKSLISLFTEQIKACFIAAIFVSILSTISIASAQSELEIENNPLDPQGEGIDELDRWLLRAYEGDRDAQFRVGVHYSDVQSSKHDPEQATYWFRQAARQGHSLAQYNLGHQYISGVGVEQNAATAM